MNAFGQALVWCALQVTLAAAATAMVYAALRRRGPALRSLVALTGLAVSVALTFAAFSPWPRWGMGSPAPAAGDITNSASNGVPVAGQSAPAGQESRTASDGAATAIDPSAIETVQSFWSAFIEELEHRPQTIESSGGWAWPGIAGLLIAIGAAVGALRLVAAALAVAAYRRFSQPIEDPALTGLAESIAGELGCRRRVELRECPQLTSAAMVGWSCPLVLLPAEWTRWSDPERRAVLAHEIAHVRRGDFAGWVCAELGLLLHFYHPLVHWLAARLRLDQELAADAAAADVSGGRQPYLRILADMALRQSDRLAGWPARAFLPTRRTFLRRIEMLRATKQVPAAASRRACAVAVGVLVLAGLAAAGLRGSGGEEALAAVQGQGDDDSQRTRPAAGARDDQADGSLYLGFIPNETQGFMAIRPVALLSRPELKSLADFLSKSDMAGTRTPWGVELREIDQLSVTVIPPVRPERRGPAMLFPVGALTIRTTAPHDFQGLIDEAAPRATRIPASGREYFVSEGEGGIAYFRPDDRTIVLGSVQDIARMIASGPEPGWQRLTSGPAARTIADAHLAVVVETALVESMFQQAQGAARDQVKLAQAQAERARAAADRAAGDANRGAEAADRARLEQQRALVEAERAQVAAQRAAAGAAVMKEQISLSAFSPLWEQAESITFAARLGDRLSLDWLFTSANADDAENVRRTVDALLTLGRNMSGNLAEVARRQAAGQPGETAVTAAINLGQELLKNAELNQEETDVRLETSAALEGAQASAIAALTESVKAARGTARRMQSVNNLKQIALAFHNYADVHGRFPPAVLYGPDGKTPHSWRVAILPFLDQEGLYRQYRFDEPWDSPNNKQVGETAVPVYRHPDAPEGSTDASYFALVGEKTIFTGAKAEGDKAGTGFQDILDGTSNTILIVEAKRGIPWTKPEDISFEADQDVPELGGYTDGGFNAAIADGSVRFIMDSIDARILKALITRAGGEPINADALQPRR